MTYYMIDVPDLATREELESLLADLDDLPDNLEVVAARETIRERLEKGLLLD